MVCLLARGISHCCRCQPLLGQHHPGRPAVSAAGQGTRGSGCQGGDGCAACSLVGGTCVCQAMFHIGLACVGVEMIAQGVASLRHISPARFLHRRRLSFVCCAQRPPSPDRRVPLPPLSHLFCAGVVSRVAGDRRPQQPAGMCVFACVHAILVHLALPALAKLPSLPPPHCSVAR